MVIDGLSSKEIKELRENQSRRPTRTRKKRSTHDVRQNHEKSVKEI